MAEPLSYILNPDQPAGAFRARGGGKATNLAHLSQRGLPVPPWFCITADAFDHFVDQHQLGPLLHAEKHTDRLDEYAREIEEQFLHHELPAALAKELDSQLSSMNLDNSLLAVRSSGIDEDSADHSFAGQFSSFLCQRGADAVRAAIRRCWASGFSERAIAYRIERGLQVSGIRIGVIVQLMVDPKASGVAFSRNPIRPLDRDHLVVESVFGLGEGLVSGELDADRFEVARNDLTIAHRDIANKDRAMRFGQQGGTSIEPVDARLAAKTSLSDEEVRRIGETVLDLEKMLGTPQDCEWAIDEPGELFLLQTRPVTNYPDDAFFDARINGRNPILWDNSNIIESYSGITSPLTFSFANSAYTRVYIQFCQVMAVPAKTIASHDAMYRNMLGHIRGHVYYNLINWYRLIQMLPLAGSSDAFMETMMGVKQQMQPELGSLFEFTRNPPRYSIPRKILVTALGTWRFLRIDSIVADFGARFDAVYDDARERSFESMSLPELADYYQFLDDNVLANWRAPIINDYLCMIFFGLLEKLTAKWIVSGDEAAPLQNDLLCGQGGLDSTEPTRLLMRIAQWAGSQDEELKTWLDATPADSIWQQLKNEGKYPELHERLEDYLDKYGFRCVNELKLEAKDLHEDPAFIIEAIRSYVRSETLDIDSLDAREAEIRDAAEQTVDDHLGGMRRLIYRWVLKHARKAVRHRENLRFARTKIFGIARRLFRAAGVHLQRLGVIENDRDVFMLTLDDLRGFIEGRPTNTDLASLVAVRKAEFDEYQNTPPPPDRLVTYGAAGASFRLPQVLADADLLRDEAQASDDPNVLVGTPCCPGIVEGVVRVVESSQDAAGIDQEILVAPRTDPGWVPLYPSCTGLLIERGSLLSHSAVVARELGLPTIVGISGGLMKKLKTGQRVRMDAGRGEVRILS